MDDIDDPGTSAGEEHIPGSVKDSASALEKAARLRSYLEHEFALQIEQARNARAHIYTPEGADKDKTVAAISDGRTAISGWDAMHDPDRSSQAVRIRAEQSGHVLGRHGFDDDFVGQYHASHAEKKLSEAAPGQPLAVSRPMCDDCQRYFLRLADMVGEALVIIDPARLHIFLPDGVHVRFAERFALEEG